MASVVENSERIASPILRRPAYWVTGCLLVAIFAFSPNFRAQSQRLEAPFAGDFLQEWIGGRIVLQGDTSRMYDPAYAQSLEHDASVVGFAWDESYYLPIVYPPFYYALVSPLSLLPFELAACVWAIAMVLALLMAWLLMRRLAVECMGLSASDERVDWLLPSALLFMPLIESLTSSQKGSLLLLILVGTYYLLNKNRGFAAGLVFGLIAFKPHLALPIAIAMLWKRQWSFVLGGLTTGAILVTICLAMGRDVCEQYVEFSLHAGDYMQNSGYDLTKSHTLRGFFALLFGDAASPFVVIATWIASIAIIAVVVYALRGRLDTTSPQFANQFFVLIIAMILLSPHLYTYDLTMLLLPLGWMACEAISRPRAEHHDRYTWAIAMFCLAGLSTQIAGMIGVQVSVVVLIAGIVAFISKTRQANAATIA